MDQRGIRLTNYYLHPGDNRYMVFEYREEEHASYFKSKLEREGIPYEDHLEAHDDAEISKKSLELLRLLYSV